MVHFQGLWMLKKCIVLKDGMLVINALELPNLGAIFLVIDIPEPSSKMSTKKGNNKHIISYQGALSQSSSAGLGVGQSLWGWLSTRPSLPKGLLWLAPLGQSKMKQVGSEPLQ